MTWLTTLALLLVGLLFIVKGGDLFVDAASWMAEKTGIPKFLIGATIVSVATTLPEMMVSALAAGGGQVDMAIGNAMGSVTANTGLILGLALVCMPGPVDMASFRLKSLLMLASSGVLVAFGLTGAIGLWPALLLAVLFAVSMVDNIRQAKAADRPGSGKLRPNTAGEVAAFQTKSTASAGPLPEPQGSAAVLDAFPGLPMGETVRGILGFVLGAAAIVLGSQLLVDNGTVLATLLGVPERIIAVTFVAIGTSLPELVTTVSAIAKKQSSLSAGNIIGANIIDLTLILPISALISGKALPVSAQFATLDIPAALVVGAIAVLPTLVTKRFHRWQGVLLIVTYCAYLFVTVAL